MPSSTSDFTVNDVLYVDRWGISTLSTFNTTLNVQVWNQSPQPIYVKAVINDSNGNWKFNDGTTEAKLGEVKGFDYAVLNAVLKRAVPSADVEDEQFTITFEFYKDSSYSTKIDQITKTIKANIIDFHSSPSGWTVSIDNFDDGKDDGWSLSTFGISDSASVESNGYSAYCSALNKTITPYMTKSISIPSGISKGALAFYWGTAGPGDVEDLYVRVYVAGTKVYEDHASVKGGWFQVGIDLTHYAGQDIDVKIEAMLNAGGLIHIAVDEIIVATKS